MQHVNIKLVAAKAEGVRAGDSIPVFHRWIQARDLPETLIDVTDYAHVPDGPGVLLIGHEANYSLDCGQSRLGMLYNRKAASEAPAGEQLRQAYEAASAAAKRLESEPEFAGRIAFEGGAVEVIFNDRLLHPNTDAGWAAIEPELRHFFDGLFGADAYSLTRAGQPRERLRAEAQRTA